MRETLREILERNSGRDVLTYNRCSHRFLLNRNFGQGLSAADNSRQARSVFAYVWRFKYDSMARRNSSAIGAPVLRDSLCRPSSSSCGNQTVVRFFMQRYSYVCQDMSGGKWTRIENKCVELASPLLAD
jgi:hypothetical protein